MNLIPAMPVLLPLLTAAVALGFRGLPRSQAVLSYVSAASQLVIAVFLAFMTLKPNGDVFVLQLGAWGPGVGIVWVIDGLSAVMLTMTAVLSLACLVYGPGDSVAVSRRNLVVPLHHFLITGVNGCFVTGDLFNLFVCFEIMLLTSFVQMTLPATAHALRRAFPYVLVNLLASMLFLLAVGFIYSVLGTVNIAAIAERASEGSLGWEFWIPASIILLVFCLKAGLAPLFNWLPDSYPVAPVGIGALLAGLLTKVGVYTLFRFVPLLSNGQTGPIQTVLLILSVVTMAAGVCGALGKSDVRSVLSFHIVSQVGYMVFGLALFTLNAVAAGIFYIVHHMVVKTSLFLSGGLIEYVCGQKGRLGECKISPGSQPALALGFFIPAMALAGMPPLSGFWAKLFLLMAGFEVEAFLATAVAVVVSFFTLGSMLKIWVGVFWHGSSRGDDHVLPPPNRKRSILVLAGISVITGILAAPVYGIAMRAATQIMQPGSYIQAVLGNGGV